MKLRKKVATRARIALRNGVTSVRLRVYICGGKMWPGWAAKAPLAVEMKIEDTEGKKHGPTPPTMAKVYFVFH